ncbi:MAG TPA: hypothetical protein VGU23_07340 [Acidobacteriaceae bacterium]|nr:hypothetical protein [Acidobacteriaceae bacterium]
MIRPLRFYLSLLAAFALALPLLAQGPDSTLSQKEIEQIRELRTNPAECVLAFVKFLDLRTDEIRTLYARPRQPGREQDTHDLMEQFTAIVDELSDNLDDYGPRHADLRHALPKIIDATERWSSTLKSPPDNEAYNISRKLALESIRDLRESATELAGEQAAWFKLHPPAKDVAPGDAPPIDIRR